MSATAIGANAPATATDHPWQSLGLDRPAVLDTFDIESVPANVRDRVRSLIPSERFIPTNRVPWDGSYVMRNVNGHIDMNAFAGSAMGWPDVRFNILLTGPTGSAKTTAVKAFCAIHRIPFVAVPVNGGIDPSTMDGTYVKNELTGEWEWIWSDYALAKLYGGGICIDEINMAHPRINAVLHEQTDDRRQFTVPQLGGAVYDIHPATLWFATMNRGYDGTAKLNWAMQRRFSWPIEWDYDNHVESVVVGSATLIDFATNVRSMPEIRNDLSTDHLVRFVDTAHMMGISFAMGRMLEAFPPDERRGIETALEMRMHSIASELGIPMDGKEDGNV